MGRHCCVPQCEANSDRCKGLTFHRFPRDEGIRSQWIAKIRRDPGKLFQIKKWTVICSRHFTSECYVEYAKSTEFSERRLRKDAIPTCFAWNNFEGPKLRKPPIVRPPPTLPSADPDEPSTENYVLDDSPLCEGDELEHRHTQQVQAERLPLSPVKMHNITNDAESRIKALEAALKEKEALLKETENKLKAKEAEVTALKMERFGLHRFSKDKKQIQFYTGFPDLTTFECFFNYIAPSARNMRTCYFQETCSAASSSQTKRSIMVLIDEFFMFCTRLRRGYATEELADRFSVSHQTVSRKLISWANFLFVVLGSFSFWPSRQEIDAHMPEEFKKNFPKTRIIIDCTEIQIQCPSSLVTNSQLFSAYKSTFTVKSLIGITPHGTVSFVSPLYTGNTSDVETVRKSGLLDLLEPGDGVMADKGFTLQKDLQEIGCTLNIPAFMNVSGQFTQEEIQENQLIASVRIHVERAIQRIKLNQLFAKPIALNTLGSLPQLWTVAVLLSNFKRPLVKKYVPSATPEVAFDDDDDLED